MYMQKKKQENKNMNSNQVVRDGDGNVFIARVDTVDGEQGLRIRRLSREGDTEETSVSADGVEPSLAYDDQEEAIYLCYVRYPSPGPVWKEFHFVKYSTLIAEGSSIYSFSPTWSTFISFTNPTNGFHPVVFVGAGVLRISYINHVNEVLVLALSKVDGSVITTFGTGIITEYPSEVRTFVNQASLFVATPSKTDALSEGKIPIDEFNNWLDVAIVTNELTETFRVTIPVGRYYMKALLDLLLDDLNQLVDGITFSFILDSSTHRTTWTYTGDASVAFIVSTSRGLSLADILGLTGSANHAFTNKTLSSKSNPTQAGFFTIAAGSNGFDLVETVNGEENNERVVVPPGRYIYGRMLEVIRDQLNEKSINGKQFSFEFNQDTLTTRWVYTGTGETYFRLSPSSLNPDVANINLGMLMGFATTRNAVFDDNELVSEGPRTLETVLLASYTISSLARRWTVLVKGGDPTLVKKNILINNAASGEVFILYENVTLGGRFRLSKFTTGGFLEWSSPEDILITNSLGGKIHRFEIFEDTPMLIYINTADSVVFQKISPSLGTPLGEGTSTVLDDFIGTVVDDTPCLLTYFPWSELYVGYVDVSSNVFSFNKYDSALTAVLPNDTIRSEISEYQYVTDETLSTAFLIYTDSFRNTRIIGTRQDNTVVFPSTVVEEGGYLPCLSCVGGFLYYQVSRFFTSFTEFYEQTIRQIPVLHPSTQPDSLNWERVTIYPSVLSITSNTGNLMRPRMVSAGARLVSVFCLADGTIVSELINRINGASIKQVVLPLKTSNVSEISLSVNNDTNIQLIAAPSLTTGGVIIYNMNLSTQEVRYETTATLSIMGDSTSNKSNLYIRQGSIETNQFYVLGKNEENGFRVSLVRNIGSDTTPNIVIEWTSDLGVSNVLGNRLVGAHMFNDYVLAFYISGSTMVCKKVSVGGGISTRERDDLTILPADGLLSRACMQATSPFENYYIAGYKTPIESTQIAGLLRPDVPTRYLSLTENTLETGVTASFTLQGISGAVINVGDKIRIKPMEPFFRDSVYIEGIIDEYVAPALAVRVVSVNPLSSTEIIISVDRAQLKVGLLTLTTTRNVGVTSFQNGQYIRGIAQLRISATETIEAVFDGIVQDYTDRTVLIDVIRMTDVPREYTRWTVRPLYAVDETLPSLSEFAVTDGSSPPVNFSFLVDTPPKTSNFRVGQRIRGRHSSTVFFDATITAYENTTISVASVTTYGPEGTYNGFVVRTLFNDWIVESPSWPVATGGAFITVGNEAVVPLYGTTSQTDFSYHQHIYDDQANFQYVASRQEGIGALVEKRTLEGTLIIAGNLPFVNTSKFAFTAYDSFQVGISGNSAVQGIGPITLNLSSAEFTATPFFIGGQIRANNPAGVTLIAQVLSYEGKKLTAEVQKIIGEGSRRSWKETSPKSFLTGELTSYSFATGAGRVFGIPEATIDETLPLLNRYVRITHDVYDNFYIDGIVQNVIEFPSGSIGLDILYAAVVGFGLAEFFSPFELRTTESSTFVVGEYVLPIIGELPSDIYQPADDIRVKITETTFGIGRIKSYTTDPLTNKTFLSFTLNQVFGSPTFWRRRADQRERFEYDPEDGATPYGRFDGTHGLKTVQFRIFNDESIDSLDVPVGTIARIEFAGPGVYAEGPVIVNRPFFGGGAGIVVVSVDKIVGLDDRDELLSTTPNTIPPVGVDYVIPKTFVVDLDSSVSRFQTGTLIRCYGLGPQGELASLVDGTVQSYSGNVITIVFNIVYNNAFPSGYEVDNWFFSRIHVFPVLSYGYTRNWSIQPITYRNLRISPLNPRSPATRVILPGTNVNFPTSPIPSDSPLKVGARVKVQHTPDVYGIGIITFATSDGIEVLITEAVNPGGVSRTGWIFLTQELPLWEIVKGDPVSIQSFPILTNSPYSISTDFLYTTDPFTVGERVRATTKNGVYGEGTFLGMNINGALVITFDVVVGADPLEVYTGWTITSRELRSKTTAMISKGTKVFTMSLAAVSTIVQPMITRLRLIPTANPDAYLEGLVTNYVSNVMTIDVYTAFGPSGQAYSGWYVDYTFTDVLLEDVGYNPSIIVQSRYIYSSHTVSKIYLTDLAAISIRKMLKDNFTTVWKTEIQVPDNDIEGLFPRILLSSDLLHVFFVREDDEIYSVRLRDISGSFNPSVPYRLGGYGPGNDRRDLAISNGVGSIGSNTPYIYLAHPSSSDEITVYRFNPAYEKTPEKGFWEITFDGGVDDTKTGLFIREDPLSGCVVVAYSVSEETPSHRITRIDSNEEGVASVTYDGKDSSLSSLVDDKLSAFYIFDQFVLLVGITNSAEVSVAKLALDTGNLSGAVRNTSGIPELVDLSGRITFLSADPWLIAYVGFISTYDGLPVLRQITYPGEATVTVQPPETSQYQMVIDDADFTYPVFYGGPEDGVTMTKFSPDGETQIQRSIDPLGQSPCVGYVSGNRLYVAYAREVSAFSSYVGIIIRKLNRESLEDDWVFVKPFADGDVSTFRPRIIVSGGSVFSIFKNNANRIIIQRNSESTGDILGVAQTPYTTDVDPREIVVEGYGNGKMILAYPSGDSGIELINYDLLSNVTLWRIEDFESTVFGSKNSLVIRVDEESDGIFISYSSTNTDVEDGPDEDNDSVSTRVARVNIVSQVVEWSVLVGWDINLSGTQAYKGRVHGFYITAKSPILFAVIVEDENLFIRVIRLNETGTTVSIRTRQVTMYDQPMFESIFQTPPMIFSREIWESVWLFYNNPDPEDDVWRIMLNRFDAPEVPEPSVSSVALSDNQFVIGEDDYLYVTYIKQNGQSEADIPSDVPEEWLIPYGKKSLINYNTPDRIYVPTNSTDPLLIYAEREADPGVYKFTFKNRSTNFNVSDIRITYERFYVVNETNNFLTARVNNAIFDIIIDSGGYFISQVLDAVKDKLNFFFPDMGFNYTLDQMTLRATWTYTKVVFLASFQFSPNSSLSLSRIMGFNVSTTNAFSFNTTTRTIVSNMDPPEEIGIQPGMGFVPFTVIPSLSPGAIVTRTMSVDFGTLFNVPLSFVIRHSTTPVSGGAVKTIGSRCILLNPLRQIKMYARYTKGVSAFGRNFTRIEVYVENKTLETTFRDVRITDISIPEGSELISFPTISSISPLEVVVAYIDIDFKSLLNVDFGFEVRSNFETIVNVLSAVPPFTSTVIIDKGFTVSLRSPKNDLDYGITSPNVINISKVQTDGVVLVNTDIDVGGQDPSIHAEGGEVFSAYAKRLVTFTDFMSLTLQKSDGNLVTQWTTVRKFPDSDVRFFKPRVRKTIYGVHLIFFRQNRILSIETFDPVNGSVKNGVFVPGIFTTVDNVGELATFATEENLFLALPTPDQGDDAFSVVSVYKLNMATQTVEWVVEIGGDTDTPKSGIFIRTSQNDVYIPVDNIFVGFVDNAERVRLCMISPTGNVMWSIIILNDLGDVYGKRIHGMYVTGGYPSVFFIRNMATGNVCNTIKVDDQGDIVEDLSLEIPSLPGGIDEGTYPMVLSRSPWDVIFIEYMTTTSIQFIEPAPFNRLGISAIRSEIEYAITLPESELSEFQSGRSENDFSFVVYSVDNGPGDTGVRLSKISSTGVITSITVDINGQTPALHVYSRGSKSKVIVSYVKTQSAFLSSIVFVRKVYDIHTLDLLYTQETFYPDASSYLNFRPRLVGTAEKLYGLYVRQDGYLYIEQMDPMTAATVFVSKTDHFLRTLNPLSIVAGTGSDNINIVYPSGSNTIVRQFLDDEWYTLTSRNNSVLIIWSSSASSGQQTATLTIPPGNYFRKQLFELLKNLLNALVGINRVFTYLYDTQTRKVEWSYKDVALLVPRVVAFEFPQDPRNSLGNFIGFPVSTVQRFDPQTKTLTSDINPLFVGTGVTLIISSVNNWVDCVKDDKIVSRITIPIGTFTLNQVLLNLRNRLNEVFPTAGFGFTIDTSTVYKIVWSYTGSGLFRFQFSPTTGESLMRFLGFTTFNFNLTDLSLVTSDFYSIPRFLGQKWVNSTVEGGSSIKVRENFGTYLGFTDLTAPSSRLKVVKLRESDGVVTWTRDVGPSSDAVGNRFNSFYSLFTYPLSFNITPAGDVIAGKLTQDGIPISSRTTPLDGLDVTNITEYPIVLSGGSWTRLTLTYYSGPTVGSILISPTKTLSLETYSTPLTFPVEVPPAEISDNQVVVQGDYVFYVHSDNDNKLLVTRHLRSNPEVVIQSYSVTEANPFSPSIRYLNNNIILSYCTYTVGFTEIVDVFLVVLNALTLSLVSKTSRGLPDPSPSTFRPRLTVSGGLIHRAYVRYDETIYLEDFDPGTNVVGDPYPTDISYEGGDVSEIALTGVNGSVSRSVFLTFPRGADLVVIKYSNGNYSSSIWTNSSVNGNMPSDLKTHPIAKTNADDTYLYIAVTSGDNKAVAIQINTVNGSVSWVTTAITSPLSGKVAQGMDIFEGFPLIYTVLPSNQLAVSKLSEDGVLVSQVLTPLTGFNYSDEVLGSGPFVVSLYPWNHMTVFHFTENSAIEYSEGRNVAIRNYSAPQVNVFPDDSTDIRTSQGVYEEEGDAQITFSTAVGGTVLSHFNKTVISTTRVIDNLGYRPSVGRSLADDFLIISFVKTSRTFTEVHSLSARRVTASPLLTDEWVQNDFLILPDGENAKETLRPLVKVFSTMFVIVYVRENGKLVIETRNKNSGALIHRLLTNHVVPNVSELVVGGFRDLCIAYPLGPEEPNKFKVIRFEYNETISRFSQRFAVVHESVTGLPINSMEIVQNVSDQVLVTYLVSDSSLGLQRAFVVRLSTSTGNILLSIEYGGVDQETGQRRWIISPTERLSGINAEGSSINFARTQTIDQILRVDLFETTPTFKGIKYSVSDFESIPDYIGNPLVIYNKGDAWLIVAYFDVTNTLRVYRNKIEEVSTRVDFDNKGYVTTSGYDYWWRPLITIQPSIKGSAVEETTTVSGQRISKVWHSNGHLYSIKRYNNQTRKIVGAENYFSKNGQWLREIANHVGNSVLREWTVPERTDARAVFEQFDRDEDGFVTTTGVDNDLDVGLALYRITIPLEARALLVSKFNLDSLGRVQFNSFFTVTRSNEYTKDIYRSIGRDKAILTYQCEVINGRKGNHSGSAFSCQEFFSSLPGGRLYREANYNNDKQVGIFNQYYNTGDLEKKIVYNSSSKIIENTSYWPGNVVREEIFYNPPGTETGARTLYDEAGNLVSQTVVETNRLDNPLIRLRVTTFWAPGIKKTEFFKDSKGQRTDVYREFFNDTIPKISVEGLYKSGNKTGVWRTFDINGTVTSTEVFRT
jgi:antitoxin component YwqK of YwqJK toxin-antitoxin module